MTEKTEQLRREIYAHLTRDIVPFWERMRDNEYGGYYGYMDFYGNVDKRAVKGSILNSRILWFFSTAYKTLKDERLLDEARHAYLFLKKYFLDTEYGGVYWSVNCDGSVCDSVKHTYAQSFAIYALAAYYGASGDIEAKKTAIELYDLLESKCRAKNGYIECFRRDFSPEENDKLSENGVIAERTMNTTLHIFEAYTGLYAVSGMDSVAKSMRELLGIFAYKIYNPKLRRQEVFFDNIWRSLIDLHSYGHDIEASWLIDEGCAALSDADRPEKFGRLARITDALAERIYERAYVNHSLLNECENGVDNKNRVWWVQAEAVVGFMNAWQKHPEEEKYLDAAIDIWEYIKGSLISKTGEWYWELDENGVPIEGRPIAEPWKCPYHNGRMCLELLLRLSRI